ncbi:similar to Saccharomyces cerevisiae YGR146C ECL1 Protein of unknown function, affects chronological lifespan [Maudiozyma saulgeensis]|uniref:Uncharacterized protein n=1 Tax=Maudiozyma saulgeensis TaxID=1789683 RepID=A0A1X7R5M1_9SACH|nr:similar to Saccharomyces cerevisiae YGR146C ECL1 Protein of unknown function, affects chronological lifespan [Kazachstania saulgeensis]
MTSPFVDYCICCDQLITTNENVLYYTRTISEIEKFHKQLYCSEKCKFSDEYMKLRLFNKNETNKESKTTECSDKFDQLVEIDDMTRDSSIFDKYSHPNDCNIYTDDSREAELKTLLTSPSLMPLKKVITTTSDNNDQITKNSKNRDFFAELKSTYSNLYVNKSPKMSNLLNDVYGSTKKQSEKIAENNYTLWLNAIKE